MHRREQVFVAETRQPRRRTARAVIDEIELRIVGKPAADRAAADLPRVGRPGRKTEVGAAETLRRRLA